jgi:hypothetical protein
MTDNKTVNTVYIYGKYAYLGTGFGVVKVNMDYAEISDSYNLGRDIRAITIEGTNIYVKNAYGSVFVAPLNGNLLDKNNWVYTLDYPSMEEDNTEWDTYYPVVSTLQPGGPKYNNFGFMKFKNNMLYTCSGRSSSSSIYNPATV